MTVSNPLIKHLEESNLQGLEDLLEGDIITGAAVVVRVERLDDPDPAFAVLQTVDYITVAGLLHLAQAMGDKNIGEEED